MRIEPRARIGVHDLETIFDERVKPRIASGAGKSVDGQLMNLRRTLERNHAKTRSSKQKCVAEQTRSRVDHRARIAERLDDRHRPRLRQPAPQRYLREIAVNSPCPRAHPRGEVP